MITYSVIVFFTITGIILISSLIGPRNPTPTKDKPFECGSISQDTIEHIKVPITFYDVALAFLIFDIEILFLLPLILLGKPGLMPAFIFIGILMIGLFFELKKNKFFFR